MADPPLFSPSPELRAGAPMSGSIDDDEPKAAAISLGGSLFGPASTSAPAPALASAPAPISASEGFSSWASQPDDELPEDDDDGRSVPTTTVLNPAPTESGMLLSGWWV